MFHSFFQFSSKVEVLILLFTFLQIYSVVRWDSKVNNFGRFSFLLLIFMRSGLLAGIRWSVCMLKSHRSLCKSFSRTGCRGCVHIPFVCMVELKFPAHFPVDHPCLTKSCLALYSFCANLLHSLIICDWSFRLCHRIAYIYCFVASYLFSLLIWFVLMALSCAAIRRDSVSLSWRFPFLSQVQVFWCEMLFIRRLKAAIEMFSFPFLFPSSCHPFRLSCCL